MRIGPDQSRLGPVRPETWYPTNKIANYNWSIRHCVNAAVFPPIAFGRI